MTTNETRDLDRACAEAMGWTAVFMIDNGFDGHVELRYAGMRPDGVSCMVPRYSTDPSALPEMLAHLRGEHGSDICFQFFSPNEWVAFSIVPVSASRTYALEGVGATITEAVARLVVAVAKAKKEQGK